jgi:lipopolysaccharide assembly outer membrane protein LptD (OstA)
LIQPHLVPAASHRSIIALWLVLGLAPQASAQDSCLVPEPLELSPLPAAQSAADDSSDDDVLEFVTSRIDGVSDTEASFGEVEINYRDGTLRAQSLSLDENGDADLLGRVELVAPDVLVYGEDAHYDPASICRRGRPAAPRSRSR